MGISHQLRRYRGICTRDEKHHSKTGRWLGSQGLCSSQPLPLSLSQAAMTSSCFLQRPGGSGLASPCTGKKCQLTTTTRRGWLLHFPPSAFCPTELHGQIDALILAAILLPQEWWMIAGLTKPQVAFGLIFGIPRAKCVRALLLTGLLLVKTLIWFGNWPLQLIRQPTPNRYDGDNLWLGLWPFQVPIGILLILLGISRKDERWLVSASPFLLPYTAISSLLGP